MRTPVIRWSATSRIQVTSPKVVSHHFHEVQREKWAYKVRPLYNFCIPFLRKPQVQEHGTRVGEPLLPFVPLRFDASRVGGPSCSSFLSVSTPGALPTIRSHCFDASWVGEPLPLSVWSYIHLGFSERWCFGLFQLFVGNLFITIF